MYLKTWYSTKPATIHPQNVHQEQNVTMKNYGWSLHNEAIHPFSGLLNKTWNLHFVKPMLFPLWTPTHINTIVSSCRSAVVEVKNHWRHLTLTRDMLTLFCTQDTLGTFLPSAVKTLLCPFVGSGSVLASHHLVRLQVVFVIQGVQEVQLLLHGRQVHTQVPAHARDEAALQLLALARH